MKTRFKFLEHTADAYIEAYGNSLEEAFESAGLAFTDVMTTLETVEAKTEETFAVEAQDEEALLYSWLEELLLAFELKQMLFSSFEVSSITPTAKGLKLVAKAWGETYDPERHVSKVGVKAATYHQMKIVKDSDGVVLRFLLDI
ncbi:MAG: archease [Candidatus Bathyarchaeota archaeon]|nr:archease [Candidatus Bathyarchaeum tardum]WGM89399.1 MAG: archease [Candidatus Bathyarchaeum tardum]WNZ28321.1 MAG: archease [Candidatus Bathyarchaeota archaeon]